MKVNQLLFLLASSCIGITGFAQGKKSSGGGTSFGIRAGLNLQNINGRDTRDEKLENKLVARFHAGVNAELGLADEFYVQPGVLFSTKGTKFKGSDASLNISYIEVPINLLYKPELGGGKLLLGFGPYIAFGIGGKLKANNGESRTIAFKNEVTTSDLTSGRPYLRRLDAGANLLFGYELSSQLSVQLNTQLGLTKINSTYKGVVGVIGNNDREKFRNTGFGLSVGYRFGGN
jgi:hypothetical protein